MTIRELRLDDRREGRRFIDVGYRLRRDDDRWVPPLRRHLRRDLDPSRNPFFAHSDAAAFVVSVGGEDVGRILVMEHRPYNERAAAPAGLWGMFDCIDDQDAADALFDAAASWSAERGLVRLAGPRGFMPGLGAGLLVEGHDHPPALGMPQDPPRYRDLVERAGFSPSGDIVSASVDRGHEVPPQLVQLADAVATAGGLEVVDIGSRRRLRRSAPFLSELYNSVFDEAYDDCPISEAEMAVLLGRLAPVADPSLITFVRQDEEVVGFTVALPAVADGLRRAGGRWLPFGWWHVRRAARASRSAEIHVFGVRPEHRATGVNVVIYGTVVRRGFGLRYTDGEIVQVYEGNDRMLGNLEMAGITRWVKRHRLYERPI